MYERKNRSGEEVRVIESTKDVFGADIRVGDLIVHAVSICDSPGLTISRVREVREVLQEVRRWNQETRQYDKSSKWVPQLGLTKLDGTKTTVYFLDRVVRAPDGWTPPHPTSSITFTK